MMWLAWRQFRTQALVVAGALVVLGVFLALSGSHIVHYADTTLATCNRHNDCGPVESNFEAMNHWIHPLGAFVLAVPALVGIFWGAPLVARELETRTNRLVWTQSISRSRWFLTKVAVVGVGGVVATALVSWMVTWWASPYDRVQAIPYNAFDQRDLVPVGYSLFAFALGVALGALVRRTLPAMAATLVAFLGVRYGVSQWLRPRLIPPVHALTAFSPPFLYGAGTRFSPPGIGSLNPADWFLSEETLTATGRVIGQNGGIGPQGLLNFSRAADGSTVLDGVGRCPNAFPGAPSGNSTGGKVAQVSQSLNDATARCIKSFHLKTLATFQPESRYWPFQWAETAIFVALAVVLLGGALWWVRRRLS